MYMAMWLEGPLQSWGYDSRFGVRSTFSFPTKSGIAGMLLCSMGRGGEERDFLKKFSSCDEKVISYVRSDGGNLMTDFHVVGNGFDMSDGWESNMVPRKRDGGKAVGGGSKITYRQFLQDTAFAVIQEIPDDIGDEVSEGLKYPVWPICLGRKTCIPSYPVFQGVFDNCNDAESALVELAEKRGYQENGRLLDGSFPEEGEVTCLPDVPVAFGHQKEYAERFVTVIR